MENHEREYSGWCPTQLLPWIQNQDLKELVFGIGTILVAGKLTRILIDFFDFPKFSLLLSGTAVLLDLEDAVGWILNQDLKKLVVFGIGMILVAGALTYLKNELIDPIIDYGNTIGWCPV